KPSALPAWRPSRPLSSGPTLFFAPSPTEWQGRHFLNDCSPAATSCAEAAAVEAASANAARTTGLITPSLSVGAAGRPGRPPMGRMVALLGGRGYGCQRRKPTFRVGACVLCGYNAVSLE